MKKLILSLLTLSLLGGLFTFLPAGASRNFPDVNQVHPYFRAVETLALRGVVEGYPDGFFRPDDPVSRVEALKIAMLASQKNVSFLKGDVDFPDVATDSWYAPYIERAQKDGIIKGFSDGFFYPDQKITYMEALKIIMKLNGILEDYEPEGDLWFLPYLKVADDYDLLDPIMARKPEMLARQDRIRASWISRAEMAHLAFEIWSKRDILSVKARTLRKALAYKPFDKYADIDLETENKTSYTARDTQIIGKYERAQRVAQEDFDSIITQRGIDLAKKAYQMAAYEPGVMQFWPFAFQETNLTLEEWYMMKISNILKRKNM